MRGYLCLGSNLGRRLGNLERALQWLAGTPELTVHRVSSIYDSQPWGYESENRYLNIVAEISWIGTPESLLKHCLYVEEKSGREPRTKGSALAEMNQPAYSDRVLDVDILWLEGAERDDPDLVLPHPLAHKRAFVLAAWSELAPQLSLRGRKLNRWFEELPPEDAAKVKKLGSVELSSLKVR